MTNKTPQLRTPGVIASELGEPLSRVLYILRTQSHLIKPIGRAGCLRLYDRTAVDMVSPHCVKLKNGADDYGFDDLDITNFIIKGTCVTTEHWRRVRRDKPCPICGRPDWCLISTDDTAAICARVQSERRIGEAGFLHRLQERQPSVTRRVRSVYLPLSSNSKLHLAELVGRYQAAVHDAELCKLAKRLGLTVDGLRALRIGWTGTAWSFPMTNVAGAVLGVRLRSTEAQICCQRGRRRTFYSVVDYPDRQ